MLYNNKGLTTLPALFSMMQLPACILFNDAAAWSLPTMQAEEICMVGQSLRDALPTMQACSFWIHSRFFRNIIYYFKSPLL